MADLVTEYRRSRPSWPQERFVSYVVLAWVLTIEALAILALCALPMVV